MLKIDSKSVKAFKNDLNFLEDRGRKISKSQQIWDLIDKDNKIEYDDKGRPSMKEEHQEYWKNLKDQGLVETDDKHRVSMSPKYWALLERNEEEKLSEKQDDPNAETLEEVNESKINDKESDKKSENSNEVFERSNKGGNEYFDEFENKKSRIGQKKKRQKGPYQSHFKEPNKSFYFEDWQRLADDYELIDNDTGQRLSKSKYAGDFGRMEQDRVVLIDKNTGQYLRPSVYFNHQKLITSDQQLPKPIDPPSPKINSSIHKTNTKRFSEFKSQNFLDLKKLESESILLFDQKHNQYISYSIYEDDFLAMERDGLLIHDKRAGAFYRPSVYFSEYQKIIDYESKKKNDKSMGLFDPEEGRFVDVSLYEGDWRKMEHDGLLVKNKQTGEVVRPSIYFGDWRRMEGGGSRRKTWAERASLYEGDWQKMVHSLGEGPKKQGTTTFHKSLYPGEFQRMERSGPRKLTRSANDNTHSLTEREMFLMERDWHKKPQNDPNFPETPIYHGDFQRLERDSKLPKLPIKDPNYHHKSIYLNDWRQMEGFTKPKSRSMLEPSLYPGDWDRMEGRRRNEGKEGRDRTHSLYDYDRRMLDEKREKQGGDRVSLRPSTLKFLNENPQFYRKKGGHSRLSLRPSTLEFLNEDEREYLEDLRRRQEEGDGEEGSKRDRISFQNSQFGKRESEERISEDVQEENEDKSEKIGTEGEDIKEVKDESHKQDNVEDDKIDPKDQNESKKEESMEDEPLYPPRQSKPKIEENETPLSKKTQSKQYNSKNQIKNSHQNSQQTKEESKQPSMPESNPLSNFSGKNPYTPNPEFQNHMEWFKDQMMNPENQSLQSLVNSEQKSNDPLWSQMPNKAYKSEDQLHKLIGEIQKVRQLDDQSNQLFRKMILKPEEINEEKSEKESIDPKGNDKDYTDEKVGVSESEDQGEHEPKDFISSKQFIRNPKNSGDVYNESDFTSKFKKKKSSFRETLEQSEAKNDTSDPIFSANHDDPKDNELEPTPDTYDPNHEISGSKAKPHNIDTPYTENPESITSPGANRDQRNKVEADNEIIKRIDVSDLVRIDEVGPANLLYLAVVEEFINKNDLKVLLENIILDPREKMFTLKMRYEGQGHVAPNNLKDVRSSKGPNRVSFGSPEGRRSVSRSPDSRVSNDKMISLTWEEAKFSKKFKIYALKDKTDAEIESFIQRKQELAESVLFHENVVQVADPEDSKSKLKFFIEHIRDPLEFEETYIIKNHAKLKERVIQEHLLNENQKKGDEEIVMDSNHDKREQRISKKSMTPNSGAKFVNIVDFVLDEDYLNRMNIDRSQLDTFPLNDQNEVVKRFVNVLYLPPTPGDATDRNEDSNLLVFGEIGQTRESDVYPRSSIHLKKPNHLSNVSFDANKDRQPSRKEITALRISRLEKAKKKILTSPNVSNRSIYHRNCAYSNEELKPMSNNKKRKKRPDFSRSKGKKYIVNARPKSYTNFSIRNKRKKNFSSKSQAITRPKSPVNRLHKIPPGKVSPNKAKTVKGLNTGRLPPKFGKNYYDKNPEFYYQMDAKLRKVTDTPENKWNLEGPSFVSYMPSVLNETLPKKNFYDRDSVNKNALISPRLAMEHSEFSPAKNIQSQKLIRKKNNTPEYFNRARYERGDNPAFETVYNQSYNLRRPGYNLECSQRSYKVSRHYQKSGSKSIDGSEVGKSTGRRRYDRSFENNSRLSRGAGSLRKESKTLPKKFREPKLHPLQFCNFCDNYFHEKCFDEYYKNRKNQN